MSRIVYKIVLFGILTAILGSSLYPTRVIGQENTAPQDMARYFPARVDGFASFRIDGTSIEQLDRLLELVLSPFARSMPQLSFRDVFSIFTNDNLDELLLWLGDYAAVGINFDQFFVNTTAVIEVDDVNAARAFVRTRFPNFTERSLNEYTLFTDQSTSDYGAVSIELIGTRMVISPGKIGIGQFPTSQLLLDDEAFQQAVSSLPASNYTSIMYAGWNWPYNLVSLLFPTEAQGGLEQRLLELGLEPGSLGAAPLAIGLTILDGDTLTIDTAQLPRQQTNRPFALNPDFLSYVPTDVDVVLHASNLTGLYGSVAATANDIIGRGNAMNSGTQPNLVMQFESFVAQYGIDLYNDLLSWTTSDYAIFARADVMSIAEAAARGRLDINDRYDFGLAIRATNPAAAQSFIDRLGRTLLRTAPSGLSVAGGQLNDVSVTTLSLTIPISPSDVIGLELMMGVIEDVFFLATPRMAQSIVTRESSLADQADFQNYRQYFLPQPTSVWYANSKGLVISAFMNPISAVIGLALMGPAIGNIYAVVCDTQGNCTPLPTPTPTPTPDPTNVTQPLQSLLNTIRTTSVSSTMTEDGITLVRLTVTFNGAIDSQRQISQGVGLLSPQLGAIVIPVGADVQGYARPASSDRVVFTMRQSIRLNSSGNPQWAVVLDGPFEVDGEQWWLSIFQDESTIGYIRASQVRQATVADLFPLDGILQSIDSIEKLSEVVASGRLEPIATPCTAFGVTTMVSEAVEQSTTDIQELCTVTLALRDLALAVAQRGAAPLVVIDGLNQIYGISETGLRELLSRVAPGNTISCSDFSGVFDITCNRVRSQRVVPSGMSDQVIADLVGRWHSRTDSAALEFSADGSVIYQTSSGSTQGHFQFIADNRIMIFLGESWSDCALTLSRSLVCSGSTETNVFERE
jgi:hypothetical protein